MRDLAPDIVRRRLLIEGHFSAATDAARIGDFLLGLAAHLDLRTYGAPVVFAPDDGMGRGVNAGYDAFVPLIDSGISMYVWSGPKFLSVLVYSCKDFDAGAAVAFTRARFAITGETATHAF